MLRYVRFELVVARHGLRECRLGRQRAGYKSNQRQ